MSDSLKEFFVLFGMLLLMLLISIALYFLLRKKDEKYKKIPFLVIASLILVGEIIKQVLSLSSMGGYSLFDIPLHFCSLFLYFFPIAAFFKGKIGHYGRSLSFITSTMLIALFYLDPSSIIGSSSLAPFSSFSSFHTFTYHHLAMLWPMVSLSLNFYKPKKTDYIFIIITLSVYMLIAASMSHLINVNFCNMLHSNIPFMQSLLDNAGYGVYYIVMLAFGLSISILIWLLLIFIRKLRRNKL